MDLLNENELVSAVDPVPGLGATTIKLPHGGAKFSQVPVLGE